MLGQHLRRGPSGYLEEYPSSRLLRRVLDPLPVSRACALLASNGPMSVFSTPLALTFSSLSSSDSVSSLELLESLLSSSSSSSTLAAGLSAAVGVLVVPALARFAERRGESQRELEKLFLQSREANILEHHRSDEFVKVSDRPELVLVEIENSLFCGIDFHHHLFYSRYFVLCFLSICQWRVKMRFNSLHWLLDHRNNILK